MTYKNLILLVVKMILDILSRILIFSAWMYTDNNGQFSTLRTLSFYYGLFLLLTAFNVVINREENWISKIISYVCFKSYYIYSRYFAELIKQCSFLYQF